MGHTQNAKNPYPFYPLLELFFKFNNIQQKKVGKLSAKKWVNAYPLTHSLALGIKKGLGDSPGPVSFQPLLNFANPTDARQIIWRMIVRRIYHLIPLFFFDGCQKSISLPLLFSVVNAFQCYVSRRPRHPKLFGAASFD